MPPRRQQTRKVAATKETQPAPLRRESQVLTVSPTPDPALEGIDPIQKQYIGPLDNAGRDGRGCATTTQLATP